MESLRVLRTILQLKEHELQVIRQHAETSQIPQSEVATKMAEIEVARARLQQAERFAKYRKRLVDIAQTEYEMLMEANKKAPNAVSQADVRRAEIMVELARLKYAELAE
jgi:hypothetical protein